ncbi:MAG: phage minor tail protein L [Methanogenium sp.]|jgi:lambda family phage minor tail protein L
MSRYTSPDIMSDAQNAGVGTIVELIELYTSSCGDTDGPYYLCNNTTTSGTIVYWGGIAYNPIEYKMTGYGMSGEGSLERPTVTIGNGARTLAALVNDYDGLVGATLKRRRTMREYLDDGAYPSNSVEMASETYLINSVKEYNKFNIVFELTAEIDREDKVIPNAKAWKNFCPFIYRSYINGAFNYDNVYECPYTTSSGTFYKRDGTSTSDPSEDVCGKRLSDCLLRFPTASGAGSIVPFGGFPGMTSLRV